MAQTIDVSERKITGCLEEIKSKAEEFSVKQLSLRDFIREELKSLDQSEILRAQKVYQLSLDINKSLEDFVQTQNDSTDAVLKRVSNNTVEFQALSESTKKSMEVILRSVLQENSRTQTQSTHIHQKLEHIAKFLESVQSLRTEGRNQPQSPQASRSNITATAQALFDSLWVLWKSFDGVIRQFVLVNCFP